MMFVLACRSDERIDITIVSDQQRNVLNVVINDEDIKAKIVALLNTQRREPAKFYGDYFLEIVRNGKKQMMKVCRNYIGVEGLTYVLDGDLGEIIQIYLKNQGKLKWIPLPSE